MLYFQSLENLSLLKGSDPINVFFFFNLEFVKKLMEKVKGCFYEHFIVQTSGKSEEFI